MSVMDIKPVAEGTFCSLDEQVISMKGRNYYAACDQLVRKRPDGGSNFCIRQAGHEDNNHIDYSGYCTNPVTYIGEDCEQDLPEVTSPTIEGGVQNVSLDGYSDDEDGPNPTDGLTVTLTVSCKDREQVDRAVDVLLPPTLAMALQEGRYVSLSVYDVSREY